TGETVAVNCAGPFDRFDATLLDTCLQARCHYVDIADDRAYVSLVRSYHEHFRERGLAAVFGCSSLPGISGALGLVARENTDRVPEQARVTLFIGNRNAKGTAAIRSAVRVIGKPIVAPQGTLVGFRDREVVPLPEPFGCRAVYNFESPDYDVLPELLGVRSLSVKLGFELPVVTGSFALLASLSSNYGDRTAKLLEWLGKPMGRVGSSGAVVQTDLFFADGAMRSVALLARRDGQRMAALPCALVVQRLCENDGLPSGVMTAYDLLGAMALIDRLAAEGFELQRSSA